MAALVDFSSNFNLTTGAYWHLQFRKPSGLFMAANLKKCPREGIFEMNSKHNELSRSHLPQINFLIQCEKKTKQNTKSPPQKIVSIYNYLEEEDS